MPAKVKTKKCQFKACGAPFKPIVEWQKFCSNRHRVANFKANESAIIKFARKTMNAQAAK